MSELKRCPFCGGEAEIRQSYINYDCVATMGFEIKCKRCRLRTMAFFEKEEAIESWNTRKPVDDVLERLEMLKEYERNCDCPKDGMCDHHNCGTCYTDSAIEIVKEVMGYD